MYHNVKVRYWAKLQGAISNEKLVYYNNSNASSLHITMLVQIMENENVACNILGYPVKRYEPE